MLKKLFVTVFGLALVLGALLFVFVGMIKTIKAAYANMAQPPTPVTTIVLKASSWQPTLYSVGSLSAVQGVTVAAQLDGTVTGIDFQSGAKVKAGDLLVQMDIGPEEAQLHAAQAALHLAQINLKRSRELLARNTISQSQLDTDVANEEQALAQVENIQATIAKKTIRAPFSGRLGVRLVDLGQTLKAGDPIVSLQALDPIYVDFYLPQQEISQLSPALGVNATCDAYPGQTFHGKINAINPDVDMSTRNLRVQATLPNHNDELRPGMFVDVNVIEPKRVTVHAIPQTAVLFAPFGDSVFLVVPGKDPKTGAAIQVTKQVFVTLGTRQGDYVDVTAGLKDGDIVISSGAFKLQPGIPVVITQQLRPDAELHPQPADT